MMRFACAAAALAALGAAAPAAAGPAPFVMPDLTPAATLDAELMVGRADFFGADVTLMRFDLEGNFVVGPRLVLSALLPIAYASIDGGGGGDQDGLGLGNLTGTLRHTSSSLRPGGAVIDAGFEVSLSLPTASDEGDGGAAAGLTAFFYVPEIGRYLPDATTVRVRGNLRRTGAGMFVQGQLGLDQLFIGNDGLFADEDLTLLRLGLAGGIAMSRTLTGVVELTTLSNLLEDGASDDEEFIHTLDLGIRYQDAALALGFRVYLPLDEAYRDADLLGFGFDVSTRL